MMNITPITDSSTLLKYCEIWKKYEYITIDTEFMREKTYWPTLCLIQIGGQSECMAIDPMSKQLELSPLYDLMINSKVTKVFHAARQDIEVFYHLTGKIPFPIFDTQIAAMVCGFGDAVSYQKLASRYAGAKIDKTLRFTDWAQRPLTSDQITYAISDVSHLRTVYESLSAELDKNERHSWISQEMEILTSSSTYINNPKDAWKRIKSRNNKPRFIAILKALSAWREEEAQRRNVPRNRVLRDDSLCEIATVAPTKIDQIMKLRTYNHALSRKETVGAVIETVKDVLSKGENSYPVPTITPEKVNINSALMDLLKVMLKMRCEQSGVAQKLIATVSELEKFAAGSKDSKLLRGWRYEIFGKMAVALKAGDAALTIENGKIKIVERNHSK